jgi:aminoglycoside 3'-phosphotransferase-2
MARDHLGMSDARVFRLVTETETLFLKAVTGYDVSELMNEAARIRWLAGRLPVPRIRYADLHGETYCLLLTEVPERDASKLPLPPDRLTRLLAEGMRTIHDLDISDCPFDHRLEKRIEAAKARLGAGSIDIGDFDAERRGRGPADLFAELLKTRPDSEDLTFTHGDCCLPNILIDPDAGRISGYVIWAAPG